MQVKGLRDDTTCIVVDIFPPEKNLPPMPATKKPVKGVFKAMFRKKSAESTSHSEREYVEPDMVEEIFEDGSACLTKRFDLLIHLSLCLSFDSLSLFFFLAIRES